MLTEENSSLLLLLKCFNKLFSAVAATAQNPALDNVGRLWQRATHWKDYMTCI